MSKLIHLTFQSLSRCALCPTRAILVDVVRAISRVARHRLLLFGIGHDHGHLVLRVQGRDLRDLRSALWRAVERRTEELGGFHVEPVADIDHLGVLLSYGPRQAWKHGLIDDPLLYLGSHLPDVLGCRVVPGYDAGRLRGELPGIDLATSILRSLGIQEAPSPADADVVRRLGAAALLEGAMDALGVSARSKNPESQLAVRAFVQVGQDARIPRNELLLAANISSSAYHRAALAAVPPAVSAAVRMRLGVVELAARSPREERLIPPTTPLPARRPREGRRPTLEGP